VPHQNTKAKTFITENGHGNNSPHGIKHVYIICDSTNWVLGVSHYTCVNCGKVQYTASLSDNTWVLVWHHVIQSTYVPAHEGDLALPQSLLTSSVFLGLSENSLMDFTILGNCL